MFHAGAERIGDWNRTHGRALDEDVDEMAGRGRFRIPCGEQSDFVTNAGVTQFSDPEPGIDDLRERQRFPELAHGFDGDADDRRLVDIETPLVNQVPVDHRIEVRIIDHVIDVAVDVVIHPARWDSQKMPVVLPAFNIGSHVPRSLAVSLFHVIQRAS